MPSYDFSVDVEALVNAARATADSVAFVKDHDVSDLVPGQGGSRQLDRLDAVDEFQERWERGVNDMVGDVEEVSGRIGKVAMNYVEFDQQNGEALVALGQGATPALNPWGAR